MRGSHGKRLAFGILKTDGIVMPHPPVARALGIVEHTLSLLGHVVIPWTPPSHARANAIGMTTWLYDGGADVFEQFARSGEPISVQIRRIYGDKPVAPLTGGQIAGNNVLKREFEKEYLEYWNSMAGVTGTERSVDTFVMPIAPVAALRPEMFYYGVMRVR